MEHGRKKKQQLLDTSVCQYKALTQGQEPKLGWSITASDLSCTEVAQFAWQNAGDITRVHTLACIVNKANMVYEWLFSLFIKYNLSD